MGSISKRLHAKLTKMAPPNMPVAPGDGVGEVPGVEELIRQGFDPVHAAYVFVQNITSLFAEWVSPLPEMKAFARIAGTAEEEYVPDGPPISPLTRSFFTAWAFYDLRFAGTDTLGLCLMEANDVVGLNADQLDALKKLSGSRMGVYEFAGADGSHVRLRELVTNAEFTCHCPSGYRGRSGELCYVRLLPPLVPDLADYHIVFTTPYILIGAGKDDWTQFFGRNLPQPGGKSAGLHSFMKYGPASNYWNELVFRAYHHHQSEAIFLAGVPELKTTLPHA